MLFNTLKCFSSDATSSDSDTDTESSATELGSFELLPDFLQKSLQAQGIVTPSPVQVKVIASALAGRDLIVRAPTGSGKTLAFALPIITRLTAEKALRPGARALVLTPTRELAVQVEEVFAQNIARQNLRSLAITGGSSYYRQKKALSAGVDIVAGTPGRIVDLIEQGVLVLDNVELFVLDEVDQMLDVGFHEALTKIAAALPASRQTLFFSATLPTRVRSVAHKMLNSGVIEICLEQGRNTEAPSIKHGYLEVREGAQVKALVNALLYHNPRQALIFCQTRQQCAEVSDALMQRGFNAAALHGDLNQTERQSTMNRFRDSRLRFLVATNVAARGIDVQGLPLVVNLDVPWEVESYTHRVGRTARAGASGEAWTFVTPRAARTFRNLVQQARIVAERVKLPTASEVLHRNVENQMAELRDSPTDAHSHIVESAVELALSVLSAEEKETLLKGMFAKSVSKLNVFESKDLVTDRSFMDSPEKRTFSGGKKKSFSTGTSTAKKWSPAAKPTFGGGKKWGGEKRAADKPRPFGGAGKFDTKSRAARPG